MAKQKKSFFTVNEIVSLSFSQLLSLKSFSRNMAQASYGSSFSPNHVHASPVSFSNRYEIKTAFQFSSFYFFDYIFNNQVESEHLSSFVA